MSNATEVKLRTIPVFRDLGDEELRVLAMVLHEMRVEPGREICKEGEPGRSCFFVYEGEVEVVKSVPGGSDRVLATLRGGDMFGQVSLLDAGPRSASCRAKKTTTVFRLERSDFETLFTSGSGFAARFQLAITRIAVSQLREANRRLNLLLTRRRTSDSPPGDDALRDIQAILARSDGYSSGDIKWLD